MLSFGHGALQPWSFGMEPWIIALIAFHILLFTLAVKRRSSMTTQMALFLFAMLGVFSAEIINNFLARHCALFASQQYFDFDGVFISTLWSGPLLLMSTMILKEYKVFDEGKKSAKRCKLVTSIWKATQAETSRCGIYYTARRCIWQGLLQ